MPEPGIKPRSSRTQVLSVTSMPLSQLNILIEVKLFNCFSVMGRNINKQSQIYKPHFFNKVAFLYLFNNAYSTLHADSPLSAKLRGKFKLCEETHGGHYLGHSQNSVEFCGVDKFPRRNTWTIAIAELALTVKIYWFYWSAEELRGRYLCQSLNIH